MTSPTGSADSNGSPRGGSGALVSYDERALTERPMTFASKHGDPLIWGVCTCEVCWYERCAKRQAEAAEREADQVVALKKIEANTALVLRRIEAAKQRRDAYWTENVAGFTAVFIGGWSLFATWVAGNAVYVFLYHPH